MERKHILFLPRWYPYEDDPMFGLFVKRHVQAVLPYHEVSVLMVHPVVDLPEIYRETEGDEEGIYTVRVFFRVPSEGLSLLARGRSMMRFWEAAKRGLKRIEARKGLPHIAHVHVLTRHGVFALWMKRRFRIPYVITEHWSRYLHHSASYSGMLRKWFTRLVVRHAEGVAPVSRDLQKAMLSHGLKNDHYEVIYNVVDTDCFVPVDRPPSTSVHRFVHVSCFEDRSKNISGILATLKALATVRTDWQCTFVGTGEDYESLMAYAAELGLTPEHVRFTGMLEGDALVQAIQEAAFLILFSHYENMPVVIAEAFACGKPVVATRVGGIPEVVNEERGLLVEAGAEQAFREALAFMLDHHTMYDAEQIRLFALSHFSSPEVGRRLNDFYGRVLLPPR